MVKSGIGFAIYKYQKHASPAIRAGKATMKLQYQLSNGAWVDCENRTEEFFGRCEKNEKKTRDEIIKILLSGETVRNDPADWYSNCRDGETANRIAAEKIAKRQEQKIVKCSCGHSVPAGNVMSTSSGTSCPNCYDRMSE